MSKRGVDLPSRLLLASIFDSLAAIQISSDPPATLPPTAGVNPIRFLPAASRNIFLTAHCLLPTTFLAALDLLEKSLVERYSTADVSDSALKVYYIRSSPPPPQSLAIPGPNFTSTSTSKPGFPRSGKSYVYEVRPAVWNCTCIEFTLAAYQERSSHQMQNKGYGSDAADEAESSSGGDSSGEEQERDIGNEDDIRKNDDNKKPEDEEGGSGNDQMELDADSDSDTNTWYGGIYTMGSETTSRNKLRNSVVPICKHLLAAVLAEKCQGLFGGYIVEKVVTDDIMAEMAVLWE
ncbi:hypothetical protein TWF730_006718 [Orbilia blumenaviensis]|uniref:Uncharacterized protein n=1 Tax=Orbilia blumenaviensis TaxID=1796055 RepID=A0AAV9VFG2_9PEZI